jgi:hypothetical protein
MFFTLLARLDDVETEGGANWYTKAQNWSVTAGISDGSAPDAAITREQLITLLYRYTDNLQQAATARALRQRRGFRLGKGNDELGCGARDHERQAGEPSGACKQRHSS